ncbi:MAG: hypothetical protein ABIN36_14630 [Ferruginibacter sp.]
MKRFLRHTVIFVFPIILLAISFEVMLRKIPNDYAFKKDHLDQHSREIEILFLGNSHVFFGIDPKYINRKSFNAAYISQSLNFDLAILKKYEGRWDKLKCIVLPIDYFSLYSTLESGIESWRVKNYRIYYDIQLTHDFVENIELFTSSLTVTISRLYTYYCLHMPVSISSFTGWGNTNKSTISQDLETGGKIAADRHTAANQSFVPANLETVRSIIEFAKTKNIQVLFFTSPAYKSYIENLDRDQLNNTIHYASVLAASYNNARYINLLNDRDFLIGDFFDADHLNEIGTKKLTLKIHQLIKQGY